MTKAIDVVIIGAGPAGSICGYLLRKSGVNCVIVDYATFPREKICGGGLTPKAYELLQDLMPELHYDYQSVNHFKLMLDGEILCEVDLAKTLRMVRRKDFDNKLLQQFLSVGGEMLKDSFSHFEEQKDGKIEVALKSGKRLTCDYLIGADGANSQVRKQLIGHRLVNTLWMEQYVAKGANEFIFEFSRHYKNGYYYSFPNIDWDIVGAGGAYASSGEIRSLLDQKKIREMVPVNDSVLRGAYISVDTVKSGENHVILIGDAGGFANKLTYEGLYYAIATGRNACKAIIEGVDFVTANHEIFRKKRKEIYITRFFYSRLGLWLMKVGAHRPKLIKKAFEMNY